MPNVNLVVASQLRPVLFLPKAHGKVLSGPLGSYIRLCTYVENMLRTYHNGQTKWLEVRFSHKVVTIETPLECQTVQKRMLQAIDTEQ